MPAEPDMPEHATFLVGQNEYRAPPLAPALYLVATPIGNLADVTIRALQVMAAADILACEDTRVTRVLLERYGIRRATTAYHEHNAERAGPKLVAALEEGRSVALVSDAGTPLVSDPGHRLVEAAIASGIGVVPIPGASAPMAALTVSGLPSDTFLFAGFLAPRSGRRSARLEELKAVPATLVFFESPRRLAASLADMAAVLGDRPAAICRELTKAFEEVRRDGLAALAAHYAKAGAPKGEIVICVGPPGPAAPASAQETDRLLLSLSSQMGASRAAAEAARMTGARKADLYRRLLEISRHE